MRKSDAFLIVAAVGLITTISVIAQDESPLRLVDLAVEPVIVHEQGTLADAARRNDFPTFDALYKDSVARGADVAPYTELHRLWTYSVSDPVGGFYGTQMHDRLAAAYPDYAAYIGDYSITDRNGVTVYPSAETRQFLLRHATGGATPRRTEPIRVTSSVKPAIKTLRVMDAPGVVRPAVRDLKPATTAQVARKRGISTVPAAVTLAVATKPSTTIATAAPPEKRVARVPAATLALPVTPRTVAATDQHAVTASEPAQRPAAGGPGIGRGIFLIIIGLLGIGVLSLMLHAPREETLSH